MHAYSNVLTKRAELIEYREKRSEEYKEDIKGDFNSKAADNLEKMQLIGNMLEFLENLQFKRTGKVIWRLLKK